MYCVTHQCCFHYFLVLLLSALPPPTLLLIMIFSDDQAWYTPRESFSDTVEEQDVVFPFDPLAELSTTSVAEKASRATCGALPCLNSYSWEQGDDGQRQEQQYHRSEDAYWSRINAASTELNLSSAINDSVQIADDDSSKPRSSHTTRNLQTRSGIGHPAESNLSISLSTTPLNPGGSHTNSTEDSLQQIHPLQSINVEEPPTSPSSHLHGLRLCLFTMGLCLAVFLVSIDRVIVTTVSLILIRITSPLMN